MKKIEQLYPRPWRSQGVLGYLRYTFDQSRMASRRDQYLAGLSWAVIELSQYHREVSWVLEHASPNPDYLQGVHEAIRLLSPPAGTMPTA